MKGDEKERRIEGEFGSVRVVRNVLFCKLVS